MCELQGKLWRPASENLFFKQKRKQKRKQTKTKQKNSNLFHDKRDRIQEDIGAIETCINQSPQQSSAFKLGATVSNHNSEFFALFVGLLQDFLNDRRTSELIQ